MEPPKNFPAVDPSRYEKLGLGQDLLLKMLRKMVEIRRFEEKVEELFLVRGALVGPSHLYIGQEAIASGITLALQEDDMIISTYRGHGHAIAKDVPMKYIMAELFGKETGTCKGLGGSMHVGIYPPKNSLYATAIVGSGIPIAAGVALGLKYKLSRQIAAVFFGDGAVNTGAFNEGMNISSAWKLPLLLVCENNMYAMGTRMDRVVSGVIAERAASYAMQSYIVDGNDPVALYLASNEASEQIRSGSGPAFLECRTYRLKGHGVYDKAEYRPPGEADGWKEKDPIAKFKDVLIKTGVCTNDYVEKIYRQVDSMVEESLEFALESKVLPFEKLNQFVYL